MGQVPIRVLYLHSSFELGGAETLRLAQLRYLDRRFVQPHVAIHKRHMTQGECWLVSAIEQLGIPVFDLKSDNSLEAVYQLRRLLDKLEPHILQTSMFEANTIGRLAVMGRRTRVLTEEHNRYVWKRPRHIIADHLLAYRTDKIIACSNAVARFSALQAHISPSRFYTIHNCLDPARVQLHRDRARVRAELGTPADAVVVVGVGRVSTQKSFDRLVKAFSRVTAAAPTELWVVGGEGGELAAVETLAHSLSRPGATIRILGERTDVGDLLHAADVFGHTARWEGFGIVLLEAMHAGLPVVAFANDGIPEVVDSSCGMLVPDGDIEGFSGVLERLIREPQTRARLGASGGQRVAAQFTPQVHVSKLMTLYQQVMGQ